MLGHSTKGLASVETKRRLVQYGRNVLVEKQRFFAPSIYIHQFTDLLIFVLLAATAVTVVLGDLVDAAVIGMAVVINTILGFFQEYKAETAIAALKKILTPQAKVIRVPNQPKEYKNIHKNYLPDVWVEPRIVLEIAGDDLTKSPTHGAGVAVRFPRLVRVREDKSPREATTVDEVVRMYHNQ